MKFTIAFLDKNGNVLKEETIEASDWSHVFAKLGGPQTVPFPPETAKVDVKHPVP